MTVKPIMLCPAPAQTEQPLLDYVNSVSLVTDFAYGIETTKLPVLRSAFPDYAKFAAEFGLARSHAMVWTESILGNFHAVPKAIVELNKIVQFHLSQLIADLEALKQNPDDLNCRQAIKDRLADLISETTQSIAAVDGVEASIGNYAAQMASDAKTLSGIAEAALVAENADRDAVAKLNDVIDDINATIHAINQRLLLDKLQNWNLGLFFVGVGFAVGIPTGGAAASVVVGLVGATIGAFAPFQSSPVSKEDAERLQRQLDRVSQEIGALNTDIAVLQAVSAQFAALSSQAEDTAGEAIKNVKLLWSDLDQHISGILDEFDQTIADLISPGGIDAAILELQTVTSQWARLAELCEELAKVHIVFEPAKPTGL